MEMIRCVVTGMGCTCCNGENVNDTFLNTVNGKVGFKKLSKVNTDGCYTMVGAEIDNFEFHSKIREELNNTTMMALKACIEAIEDSQLNICELDKSRIGIAIGSCMGGMNSRETVLRKIDKGKEIFKSDIDKISIRNIAEKISEYFEICGPVESIADACASSNISIAYGCDLIKRGNVDVMIVGGADALSNTQFSGFHALKALSSNECSPFSKSDGLTLGEGAGIIIVESLEHANKRNAKMYCEVLGYGTTSDAYHVTSPEPSGETQLKAMESALNMSKLNASDIDYVNAHGTGTYLNDTTEKRCYEKLFAKKLNSIKISSTKSMIGHCLGAAGILEAIISIKSMENNVLPPTMNFDKNNQNYNMDFIPNKFIKYNTNNIMSNSLAFGGVNSSVIFSRKVNSYKAEELNQPRVFITGIGMVNCLGIGKDSYIDFFTKRNGDKHINEMENFEQNLKKFDCIKSKYLRRMDRFSKMLTVSGINAISDAKIDFNQLEDVGIIVGTSDGPINTIESYIKQIIQKGTKGTSAILFPSISYNTAAGYLSMITKAKGYTATLVNGIESGIHSFCYSYDLIKLNRSQCIIASGVDEINDTIKKAYDMANYDKNSVTDSFRNNGFEITEGAGSIVLESEESVNKRNGRKYAEVLGYGMYNDSSKINYDGEGLKYAISMALQRCKLNPCDIGAIVGLANGHKNIDEMELKIYKNIFNDISIISIKDILGEGRAATSSMQIAHAALVLRGENKLYENSIYYCRGLKTDINNILITSYSYPHSYSAVILKKCKL